VSTLIGQEAAVGQRSPVSWVVPGRAITLMASLRAHRALAMTIFAGMLVLGLVVAEALGSPRFYSEAILRVSPRAPSTEQGAAFSEYSYIPDYRDFLQQQVFEISSYAITSAALDSLGPKRYLWQHQGESNRRAAERLLWRLKVQLIPDTYLISVGLEGTRPGDLADVVNAVVSTYLAHEESQELSGAGQGLQLLKSEKSGLQQQVDTQRAQESQLAQELGVSGFEPGMVNPFSTSLVDANEALERAQRDVIAADAHLAAIHEQYDHVQALEIDPEADQMVLKNPEVAAAKAAMIQRREADYLQLVELGPKHPGRPALEAEIKNINDLLAGIDTNARDQIRSILLQDRNAKAQIAIATAEAGLDQARRVQKATEQEVTDLHAQVAATSAKYSTAVTLHENIDNQRKQIKDIDDQIRSMQLQTESPGFVSLASSASAPDVPEKGRRRAIFALFFIAALLFALVAANGIDLMDPRIKAPAELEALLGFEPLGSIPAPEGRSTREELRRIALGIIRQRRTSGIRSFVLTPVTSGTDTTSLALELARTLDELGARTVAIEANAAAPDRRYLETSRRNEGGRTVGLSETISEYVKPVSLAKGRFHAVNDAGDSLPARIPICRHSGKPRFSLECAQSLIDLALKSHDLVLLDAPSLKDSADAAMIIQMPAGAILVVRTGTDTMAEIETAAHDLEKLAPAVVGTIMTSGTATETSPTETSPLDPAEVELNVPRSYSDRDKPVKVSA